MVTFKIPGLKYGEDGLLLLDRFRHLGFVIDLIKIFDIQNSIKQR